ncbi:MAG: hypothetical protein ACXVFL_06575 [Solirubrobacteraceae bacterium]
MAAHAPVLAGDLEVADRIARAVRSGRPGDRAPTLEQLLAAFGEREPTVVARARAGRALALAGVAVTPGVVEAPAGARLALEARGRARRPWWPIAAGAALLALAGLAAGLLAASAGSDSPAPRTVRAPAATVTLPAATVTVPAPAPRPTAAQRHRARRARLAAARRARARAPVTVRVTAGTPTFLCAQDGTGRRLFDGTLTGARTFRARVVLLNVGVAATRVLANGRPVPLAGSPTGVRITRAHSSFLPLGSRPCA